MSVEYIRKGIKTIGTSHTLPGNIIQVRDVSGRLKAWYDPATNMTRDGNNNFVGLGNSAVGMLYR